jgi:hypothetical protein
MWGVNIHFFELVRGKDRTTWPLALEQIKRSLYERAALERSRRERMRSPDDTVKKNPKELTNEGDPGQRDMFGAVAPVPAAPARVERAPALSTLLGKAFQETAEQAGWMTNMKNAGQVIRDLLALDPQPTPDEVAFATGVLMGTIKVPAGGQGVVWFERLPSAIRAGRARAAQAARAERRPGPGRVTVPSDEDDLGGVL